MNKKISALAMLCFCTISCASGDKSSSPTGFDISDEFSDQYPLKGWESDADEFDWVGEEYDTVIFHSREETDSLKDEKSIYESKANSSRFDGRVFLDSEMLRNLNKLHSYLKPFKNYFSQNEERIFVGVGGLKSTMTRTLDLYECSPYRNDIDTYKYIDEDFYIECNISSRSPSIISYYSIGESTNAHLSEKVKPLQYDVFKPETDLTPFEVYFFFSKNKKGTRFINYAYPKSSSSMTVDVKIISPESYSPR